MNVANLLITSVCTYYVVYLIKTLTNKSQVQEKNLELDKLRKLPIKTIDEQKAFINMKFPKSKKEKYFIKTLWKFIKTLALYIPIGYGFYRLLGLLPFIIPLWISITFIFIFPLLFNLCLIPFHLENENLLVMFRGWRGKK